MKNLVNILIITMVLSLTGCSEDDDSSKNKLALPATLENNTALQIPDGTGQGCGNTVTPGTAENAITIDKEGVIKDASKVSIVLSLTHAFGGDFVIMLVAPSGEVCTLIKRLGSTDLDTSCGKGCDFISGNLLTFNSANETPIDPLQAVVSAGNYAPSTGLSIFPADAEMVSLETFLEGQNIKGEWKMEVRDYGVLDLGTLVSWKLVFDTGALR